MGKVEKVAGPCGISLKKTDLQSELPKSQTYTAYRAGVFRKGEGILNRKSLWTGTDCQPWEKVTFYPGVMPNLLLFAPEKQAFRKCRIQYYH